MIQRRGGWHRYVTISLVDIFSNSNDVIWRLEVESDWILRGYNERKDGKHASTKRIAYWNDCTITYGNEIGCGMKVEDEGYR